MSDLAYPFDIVFHPAEANEGSVASDAFAAAVRTVLDAAAGEVCLVSPYLSYDVIAPIVDGREFRLVTDLDACFEGGEDRQLRTLLESECSRVRDLPHVHAKIVLSKGAALLGSANLTKQGFAGRDEIGCIIRAQPTIDTLHRWFEALFRGASKIERSDITSAVERGRICAERPHPPRTRRERRSSRAPRTLGWMSNWSPLQRPQSPGRSPRPAEQHSTVVGNYIVTVAEPVRRYDVAWSEYFQLLLDQERRPSVRIREHDRLSSYLGVIRVAQDLFARKKTFANMTTEERWKIFMPHRDLPYFGMVLVPRNFGEIARNEPTLLDAALNEIPATGPVKREQFDRFVKNLPKRAAGIVSSTRLLAMKRPDRFLCLDSFNRSLLGSSFGIKNKALSKFDGFWQLMERIWQCPWASSDEPDNELQAAVWRARVAMMDAFGFALGSVSEVDPAEASP